MVVLSGGGGARSDPSCTTVGGCETDHLLGDPSRSLNPASGTTVIVGQTITYTLSATVSDSAATTATSTDTLGSRVEFGTLTAPAVGSCRRPARRWCTPLDLGAVPRTYTFEYTAG
ncbi:hypothetical protein [Dokdonella sp.]|uniref:hypothetical protein n=1 Tax=Dokdonella sp. TaxID=2291710 RepID=UPI003528D2D3